MVSGKTEGEKRFQGGSGLLYEDRYPAFLFRIVNRNIYLIYKNISCKVSKTGICQVILARDLLSYFVHLFSYASNACNTELVTE